jgi:hypothetical protein
MKLKHIFFALIVLLSGKAFSQKCSEASLLQQPGIWKDGTKGSTSGISATELAAERKVVAALQAMIKAKYKPMGLEANYGGAYDPSMSQMPGNAYHYDIFPLNFYCEGGSLKTREQTSTYFSINANLLDFEIYENAPDELLEGYHSIDDMPIQKDGYYSFNEKVEGKGILRLITYDGKLPFAYVSKKEFLEKRKKILSVQMGYSSSSFKETLDNIEIEKKYKVAEFKNDPDKLQKYLKMDYQPRKDRYGKLLVENEKSYQPAFAKIEALLKMPTAELSQGAIVKMDPHDNGLSYLFTDDNDPFGKVLVKPNPTYFKKLPKSSPQFFWIYMKGDPKDPIAAKAMIDIMNAVDFINLKTMLGK